MKVKVSAPVYPTENLKKVLGALENIFPAVEFKESEGELIGESIDKGSLVDFKERLKNQKIRDSAKAFLLNSIEKNKLVFQINKQAACMGKINFVDFEVVLGGIEVSIKDENLEALVEWLCE